MDGCDSSDRLTVDTAGIDETVISAVTVKTVVTDGSVVTVKTVITAIGGDRVTVETVLIVEANNTVETMVME